jgi:hypothetical protein
MWDNGRMDMQPDRLGKTMAKGVGMALLTVGVKYFLGNLSAAAALMLGSVLLLYGHFPHWFKGDFWNPDRIAKAWLPVGICATALALYTASMFVHPLFVRSIPSAPAWALVRPYMSTTPAPTFRSGPSPRDAFPALEVIGFNSAGRLTLANPARTSVYVIDIIATDDTTFATESFQLGFEIPSIGIYTHELRKSPIAERLQSLTGPGDWLTYYGKAFGSLGGCLVTVFFSRSDLGLTQLIEHYKHTGQNLNFGGASGVLRYRFRGQTVTVKQVVQLTAVLFRKEPCHP